MSSLEATEALLARIDETERRLGRQRRHSCMLVLPTMMARLRARGRDHLEELGATIADVDIGDDAVSAWRTILINEATAIHEQDLRRRPADYSDDVRRYLEVGTQIPAIVYLKAQRARRRLVEGFQQAFDLVDLLVTPATAVPAHPLGEPLVRIGENTEPLFTALARLSSPLDMVGLPALSLPCGFTEGGLPIGLQIVGKPFDEGSVLRLGDAYERATDWDAQRPPV